MRAALSPWHWWRWLYEKHQREVVAGIALLVLLSAVGTYTNSRVNARQDREAIAEAQSNAVTSCENANETRKANRALWGFVIDLSLAGNKDATPQEIAYLGQVREWVNKVYQDRDCGDLSKSYPLPPPPSIPATN